MAQPFELRYHEDTTPRKQLSQEDIEFLIALQSELNTQDNACTRDPLYWGLMHTVTLRTNEDNADEYHLYYGGRDIAANLMDAILFLDDTIPFTMENLRKNNMLENIASMEDIRRILRNRTLNEDILDIKLCPVQHRDEIIPNALFLTRKDAVRHITENRHNYHSSVRPYALRADRSPVYEKLITILRTTDWTHF